MIDPRNNSNQLKEPSAISVHPRSSVVQTQPFPRVEIQITEFCPASEEFPSQFGTLTFRAWCAREAERLRPLGLTTVIQSKGSDLIALFKVL